MTIDRLYRLIAMIPGPGVSTCWVRKRNPADRGHWKLRIDGHSISARRWVWLHFLKRPIPPKGLISSACGNSACVNPEHLLCVSGGDVMSENRLRERAWCAHRNPKRKVTWAVVRRIRANRAKGVPALMADSGLGRLAVVRILRGQTWAVSENPLDTRTNPEATRSKPRK